MVRRATAIALALCIMLVGLFWDRPLEAGQTKPGLVLTNCWVMLADKSNVALPYVTTQEACVRVAPLCPIASPIATTVWQSSAQYLETNQECEARDWSKPTASAPKQPRPKAVELVDPDSKPEAPPTVPPGHQQISYVKRSGAKVSGPSSQWSDWYELCSDPLPAGYEIIMEDFDLSGDRTCGSWAECYKSKSGPDKVCYSFRMQGHDENCLGRSSDSICAGNKNEGRRDSEGYLRIAARYAYVRGPNGKPIYYKDSQRSNGAYPPGDIPNIDRSLLTTSKELKEQFCRSTLVPQGEYRTVEECVAAGAETKPRRQPRTRG